MAARASRNGIPAMVPAMPTTTTTDEMASERWCQALARSRSERTRRATTAGPVAIPDGTAVHVVKYLGSTVVVDRDLPDPEGKQD